MMKIILIVVEKTLVVLLPPNNVCLTCVDKSNLTRSLRKGFQKQDLLCI